MSRRILVTVVVQEPTDDEAKTEAASLVSQLETMTDYCIIIRPLEDDDELYQET